MVLLCVKISLGALLYFFVVLGCYSAGLISVTIFEYAGCYATVLVFVIATLIGFFAAYLDDKDKKEAKKQ